MKVDRTAYKILVVEDNSGDLLLIREYLAESAPNAVITVARTFRDAMHECTVNAGEFDVVLLDLTLPDRKGIDLIQEVLHLCPSIPVIVLTGFTDLEFGLRSMSLGVSDYLLKDDLNAHVLHKSMTYSIERRKTTEQLVESEKRYSDMFQLSPIPMWVCDLETMQFIAVNEAAIESYGFSRSEFLDMTASDVRAPEDIPELQEGLAKLRRSTDQQTAGTYRHRRKDQTELIVDIRARVIAINLRPAVLVIAHDTTERMTYMKTIELQNEALRQITWTQSHIVRAPLARIMSLTELISNEPHISGANADYLRHLSESAQELDLIIRGIISRSTAIHNS